MVRMFEEGNVMEMRLVRQALAEMVYISFVVRVRRPSEAQSEGHVALEKPTVSDRRE